MGHRRLFQRKRLSHTTCQPVPAAAAGQEEPLTAELQTELQAAWVELTEAARDSKVTIFHAYTRSGQPWTEDPAAVRAVAATLGEFPASDTQQRT
jgi:hypothetical protein